VLDGLSRVNSRARETGLWGPLSPPSGEERAPARVGRAQLHSRKRNRGWFRWGQGARAVSCGHRSLPPSEPLSRDSPGALPDPDIQLSSDDGCSPRNSPLGNRAGGGVGVRNSRPGRLRDPHRNLSRFRLRACGRARPRSRGCARPFNWYPVDSIRLVLTPPARESREGRTRVKSRARKTGLCGWLRACSDSVWPPLSTLCELRKKPDTCSARNRGPSSASRSRIHGLDTHGPAPNDRSTRTPVGRLCGRTLARSAGPGESTVVGRGSRVRWKAAVTRFSRCMKSASESRSRRPRPTRSRAQIPSLPKRDPGSIRTARARAHANGSARANRFRLTGAIFAA
jgi:hypothetical protein